MSMYAICFDFPEMNGEPIFAGWANEAPGFAPKLDTAMVFETEQHAEQFLMLSYGPIAECGTVVEVGE